MPKGTERGRGGLMNGSEEEHLKEAEESETPSGTGLGCRGPGCVPAGGDSASAAEVAAVRLLPRALCEG
eukprot:12915875-Prorocentrum_lima.AAC.1